MMIKLNNENGFVAMFSDVRWMQMFPDGLHISHHTKVLEILPDITVAFLMDDNGKTIDRIDFRRQSRSKPPEGIGSAEALETRQ